MTYASYATQCPALATGQALLSLSAQYIQETQIFLAAHANNLSAKLSNEQRQLKDTQEELEALRAQREALEHQNTDNKNTIESLHAVVFSMEPALAARLRRSEDGSLLVRSEAQMRAAKAAARRQKPARDGHRRHLVRHTVNGKVQEEHVVIEPAPETHLYPGLAPPPGTPPQVPSMKDMLGASHTRVSRTHLHSEDNQLGPPRLGASGPLLSTTTDGAVPSLAESIRHSAGSGAFAERTQQRSDVLSSAGASIFSRDDIMAGGLPLQSLGSSGVPRHGGGVRGAASTLDSALADATTRETTPRGGTDTRETSPDVRRSVGAVSAVDVATYDNAPAESIGSPASTGGSSSPAAATSVPSVEDVGQVESKAAAVQDETKEDEEGRAEEEGGSDDSYELDDSDDASAAEGKEA